ncbi:PIN2/TERF1-interacting telomerase inhibitor 1 [Halotydeus destructor]|nr:PIN2/TERF1-interacting telomerase inhibitor 1 [Halotydeus destructor]
MLAEPKRKAAWTLNPRGSLWAKDCNKFGQKLLEKMGWTEGKGLGANEDGTTEHIKTKYKVDSKGLGYKEEDTLQPLCQEYESVLADLNVKHAKTEVEARKPIKSKHRYSKIARAKDAKSYGKDALASIFAETGKDSGNDTSSCHESKDVELTECPADNRDVNEDGITELIETICKGDSKGLGYKDIAAGLNVKHAKTEVETRKPIRRRDRYSRMANDGNSYGKDALPSISAKTGKNSGDDTSSSHESKDVELTECPAENGDVDELQQSLDERKKKPSEKNYSVSCETDDEDDTNFVAPTAKQKKIKKSKAQKLEVISTVEASTANGDKPKKSKAKKLKIETNKPENGVGIQVETVETTNVNIQEPSNKGNKPKKSKAEKRKLETIKQENGVGEQVETVETTNVNIEEPSKEGNKPKKSKSKKLKIDTNKPENDADRNKLGQKLLEKMGWTEGKGLGANEDGITEPIEAIYKLDIKGLGYKDIPAGLNVKHAKTKVEARKPSKSKHRYSKMAKAKDGTTEHIKTKYKVDSKGLGYKEEDTLQPGFQSSHESKDVDPAKCPAENRDVRKLQKILDERKRLLKQIYGPVEGEKYFQAYATSCSTVEAPTANEDKPKKSKAEKLKIDTNKPENGVGEEVETVETTNVNIQEPWKARKGQWKLCGGYGRPNLRLARIIASFHLTAEKIKTHKQFSRTNLLEIGGYGYELAKDGKSYGEDALASISAKTGKNSGDDTSSSHESKDVELTECPAENRDVDELVETTNVNIEEPSEKGNKPEKSKAKKRKIETNIPENEVGESLDEREKTGCPAENRDVRKLQKILDERKMLLKQIYGAVEGEKYFQAYATSCSTVEAPTANEDKPKKSKAEKLKIDTNKPENGVGEEVETVETTNVNIEEPWKARKGQWKLCGGYGRLNLRLARIIASFHLTAEKIKTHKQFSTTNLLEIGGYGYEFQK